MMMRFVRLLVVLLPLVIAGPPPAHAQGEGQAPEAVFQVPPLNTGLGPAPDRVDRRTPRTAMGSFGRAARHEDWGAAAHVLTSANCCQSGKRARACN